MGGVNCVQMCWWWRWCVDGSGVSVLCNGGGGVLMVVMSVFCVMVVVVVVVCCGGDGGDGGGNYWWCWLFCIVNIDLLIG